MTNQTHQDLINSLMPTVRRIARRAPPGTGEHDLEDLVQVGTLGLIEAVSKHGSNEFVGGFAVHRIRGAILDYLRSQDPLTRQQRRDVKKVNAARDRVGQKVARTPRASEVAADAGISLEEYARIALQAATSHCSAEDDAVLPAEGRSPCAAFESREECTQLSEAIAGLDGRLRALIEAHYVDGESLADIGRRFRLSPARMSQLHAAAVEQLRRRMKKPRPNRLDSCGCVSASA